jgi:hypothetical protein
LLFNVSLAAEYSTPPVHVNFHPTLAATVAEVGAR